MGPRTTSTAVLLIPNTKNGHARTIPLSTRAQRRFSDELPRTTGSGVSCLRQCRPAGVGAGRSKAGIDDLHFHDLRHEAISRFFELGLTTPEVALISGIGICGCCSGTAIRSARQFEQSWMPRRPVKCEDRRRGASNVQADVRAGVLDPSRAARILLKKRLLRLWLDNRTAYFPFEPTTSWRLTTTMDCTTQEIEPCV